MLQGKKTYIMAALMLAYQVLNYMFNGQPLDIQSVLEALGLGALRAGLAKT